jgi:pantetheine-phosphate adenylyltransferase
MTVALCPGSFDPPTNGHVDVVARAARHFDRLVVAVVANPAKQPLFSAEERVELLRGALAGVHNVEVEAFSGLLVDLARARGIAVVLKGLRAVSDFEYELQMAGMNAALAEGLDTMFLTAKPAWSFLSSSLVKDVARAGGPVDDFVPPGVAAALRRRFRSTGGGPDEGSPAGPQAGR